tara:strand:- start:160 stop:462 length:303 start_codon:yes stop_codon:yes gene_type:complete
MLFVDIIVPSKEAYTQLGYLVDECIEPMAYDPFLYTATHHKGGDIHYNGKHTTRYRFTHPSEYESFKARFDLEFEENKYDFGYTTYKIETSNLKDEMVMY